MNFASMQTLMNVLLTLMYAIKPALTLMDHFIAHVMLGMHCLRIEGHVQTLMSVL